MTLSRRQAEWMDHSWVSYDALTHSPPAGCSWRGHRSTRRPPGACPARVGVCVHGTMAVIMVTVVMVAMDDRCACMHRACTVATTCTPPAVTSRAAS